MLAAESGWETPVEFHVVVDVSADLPVVKVWGEVDLATVPAFRDALSEAIDTRRPAIIVDLNHVTFMGSTGIRELVRIHDKAERIEVRAEPGIVRRALETAVLPDSFVLVDH